MKEEIIYYLKLLNFLQNQTLCESDLNRLITYLNNNEENISLADITTNIIEEVPDSIISLCLVRDVKHINIDKNMIIYNKKRFPFNNVFPNDQYDNLVNQTISFINKRVNVNKDTTLIYFGYSGAGKSTLVDRILSNFPDHKKFRLFEIYLNRYYVFYNNMKTETSSVEEEKYIFKSNNIRQTMNNFARKRSNGINSNSSRSHTVLELIFEGCTLRFIDLCGNERGTTKELIQETTFLPN